MLRCYRYKKLVELRKIRDGAVGDPDTIVAEYKKNCLKYRVGRPYKVSRLNKLMVINTPYS